MKLAIILLIVLSFVKNEQLTQYTVIKENVNTLIGTVLRNGSKLLSIDNEFFMYTENMTLLSNLERTQTHTQSASIIELSNGNIVIGDKTKIEIVDITGKGENKTIEDWTELSDNIVTEKVALINLDYDRFLIAAGSSNKLVIKIYSNSGEQTDKQVVSDTLNGAVGCVFLTQNAFCVVAKADDDYCYVFDKTNGLIGPSPLLLSEKLNTEFKITGETLRYSLVFIGSTYVEICLTKSTKTASVFCVRISININYDSKSVAPDYRSKTPKEVFGNYNDDPFSLSSIKFGEQEDFLVVCSKGNELYYMRKNSENDNIIKDGSVNNGYGFTNVFLFQNFDTFGVAYTINNKATFMVLFTPNCKDYIVNNNSLFPESVFSVNLGSYVAQGFQSPTDITVAINGTDIYGLGKVTDSSKNELTGKNFEAKDKDFSLLAPNSAGHYVISFRGVNNQKPASLEINTGFRYCRLEFTVTCDTDSCMKCPEENGVRTCKECFKTHLLINNKCEEKKKCQEGEFLDESINECLQSCEKGLYYYFGDKNCYPRDSLPKKTYFNSETKSIKDCFSRCSSCREGGDDSKHNCTGCEKGYYTLSTSTEFCINNDDVNDQTSAQFYNKYYLKKEEKKFYPCDQSCIGCQESSKICKACNEDEGYYGTDSLPGLCYLKSKKPQNFYFDAGEKKFKKCSEACKTCSKGESKETTNGKTLVLHNCDECAEGLIKNPNKERCEYPCANYFYLDVADSSYRCTEELKCPSEEHYKYLKVKNKQCSSGCDQEEYVYDLGCYSSCPNGTVNINPQVKECVPKDGCLKFVESSDLGLKEVVDTIPKRVKDYFEESNYSEGQVNIIASKKKEYVMTFFKDLKCYEKEKIDQSSFNLGDCLAKVRKHYNIDTATYIMILKLSIARVNQNDQISYKLFNSKTKEELSLDPCKEDRIEVSVPINNTKDVNLTMAEELSGIGVDVFDSTNAFFNDICFPYKNDEGKDVTLEDRRESYYQNVSFCEEGCEYKGVNYTSQQAICDCEVKTSFVVDILDNPLTGEFIEMLGKVNFVVMKCYKGVFNGKNLAKNIGSWTIIALSGINWILATIFFIQGTMPQRIALLSYMNSPPIKNAYFDDIDSNSSQRLDKSSLSKKSSSTSLKKPLEKSESSNSQFKQSWVLDTSYKKNSLDGLKKDSLKKGPEKKISVQIISKVTTPEEFNSSHDLGGKTLGEKVNKISSFGKYGPIVNGRESVNFNKDRSILNLSDQEEEMDDDELNGLDLYDAIKYDHRTFIEFYWNQLTEKQEIINTFFIRDKFDSFPLKILCFFFGIALFFTINAIFYSESYISKQFQEKGKINVLYLFKNELSRFVYSGIVSVIVGLVISYISSSKKRIYTLIKRERKVGDFREKSIKIFKEFHKKAMIFIIITFIAMGIFWYYLSAFCYCYNSTQKSWIIGSVITWVISLIFPFITCLIVACFRFFGMRFKIEASYKIASCLSD